MPRVNGILETALYVDDLDRSSQFYQHVFGFHPLVASESELSDSPLEPDSRFLPLQVPGRQVLLLFQKGATSTTSVLPGGTIPPHGGQGQLHLAFAICEDELEDWKARLSAYGVAIEGENRWPRGGTSVYFRDPDGHLLELATPGVWPIY